MSQSQLLDRATELEQESEEAIQDKIHLIFSCNDRQYGLPIRQVIEIIPLSPITPVPGMPDFIRGVINLRGRIIPAMDIRQRLNMPLVDWHERTCMVITCIDQLYIGLIVDAVNEVLRLAPEDVEAAPSLGQSEAEQYVTGIARVGEELKLLLDLGRLLNVSDRETIAQVASVN